MRILHVSDLHVSSPWRTAPLRAWLGKRLAGGANLLLGRGRAFADALPKIEALARFRAEIGADLVICTGDFTALGTRHELRTARAAVAPFEDAPLGFVAVPGNHDLYTKDVLRDDRYGEIFGDTMTTDLPEYAVEENRWPFVRLFGDDVAVVGVNSARPQPIWSSRGRIAPPQLEALSRILADARVRDRFVFVITHYIPRLDDGGPDKHMHCLVNAEDYLAVCANLPRGAILGGDVHWRYTVQVSGVRPPLYCAGSSTKEGREGLWVFDVTSDAFEATPGRWTGEGYSLSVASE